jgi:hypothetical protein
MQQMMTMMMKSRTAAAMTRSHQKSANEAPTMASAENDNKSAMNEHGTFYC